MGSAFYGITCSNCGSENGWKHDEYKDGTISYDCEDCDYRKRETYKVDKY
jgi:DNA-directed RNA polymerase subunit RPC12/RpoP